MLLNETLRVLHQAQDIWKAMSPMQKYKLLDELPYHPSVAERTNRCIRHIADNIDEFTSVIEEGEVVPFKPKARMLRHLIEIMKIRTASHNTHPWKVFVNGQYFNGYRTEQEAEKAAAAKEKEFDSFYDNAGIKYQIMTYKDVYCLLDRGVSIGVFTTAAQAEDKAEKLEAGSVSRMIKAWY